MFVWIGRYLSYYCNADMDMSINNWIKWIQPWSTQVWIKNKYLDRVLSLHVACVVFHHSWVRYGKCCMLRKVETFKVGSSYICLGILIRFPSLALIRHKHTLPCCLFEGNMVLSLFLNLCLILMLSDFAASILCFEHRCCLGSKDLQ